MSDTVFLLGAGFSRTAGIPLLGEFVDRMWEMALRGKAQSPLDEDDKRLFAAAMEIREELDSYHGRAAFNDRNIEDLLSILSFNVIGGGKKDKQKLGIMSSAIARTIELLCSVQHPGINFKHGRVVNEGPDLYRNFWKAIFTAANLGHSIPTFITFNYDLVLERSLLQVLIGTSYGSSNRLPFSRFRIDYHYGPLQPKAYDIRYTTFERLSERRTVEEGVMLAEANPAQSNNSKPIEILKLHGSLNFPRKSIDSKREEFDTSLTRAVSDPFILPPVFNKASGDAAAQMWKIAIERIRNAKNIVIVGYSLPATDIYMQYFLKAGVGPNRNLSKIVVFDPLLFSDLPGSDAMKARYGSCFSPQLRDRIDFRPIGENGRVQPGTADALVSILAGKPATLLF